MFSKRNRKNKIKIYLIPWSNYADSIVSLDHYFFKLFSICWRPHFLKWKLLYNTLNIIISSKNDKKVSKNVSEISQKYFLIFSVQIFAFVRWVTAEKIAKSVGHIQVSISSTFYTGILRWYFGDKNYKAETLLEKAAQSIFVQKMRV